MDPDRPAGIENSGSPAGRSNVTGERDMASNGRIRLAVNQPFKIARQGKESILCELSRHARATVMTFETQLGA